MVCTSLSALSSPSDKYDLCPSLVHAKSGYTAIEEYIMYAYTESQHCSAPLNIAFQAKNC